MRVLAGSLAVGSGLTLGLVLYADQILLRRERHQEPQDAPLPLPVAANGTLPKTTSGKVQRYACKAAYEAGRLTH